MYYVFCTVEAEYFDLSLFLSNRPRGRKLNSVLCCHDTREKKRRRRKRKRDEPQRIRAENSTDGRAVIYSIFARFIVEKRFILAALNNEHVLESEP